MLSLLFTACTFKVPVDGARFPAADLQPGPADLAAADLRTGDLLAPDLRPIVRPDLMMPPDLGGPCGSHRNTRLCRAGGAGRCDEHYEYHPDRLCTGDGCEDGHCRKPDPPIPCQRDADCAMSPPGTSCQLFTNLFNVSGQYCAPRPGPGADLAACQQHADCIWNTCFPGITPGGRCLRPCRAQEDCSPTLRCTFMSALIEGYSLTTTFCAP